MPPSSLVKSLITASRSSTTIVSAAANLVPSPLAWTPRRFLIASSAFLRPLSVLSNLTSLPNTAKMTANNSGFANANNNASSTSGRPSSNSNRNVLSRMSSWRRNLSFVVPRKQQSRSISSVPSVASSSSSDEDFSGSSRRRFSATTARGDNESKLSSSRARAAVNLLPSYLVDARAIVQYSPSTPDGALQLSVAENRLAELPVEGLVGIQEPTMAGGIATVGKKDLRLSDVLSQLASSNIARPTDEGARAMNVFERDMIYYQPTHGVPSVREAMADFLHDLLVKPTHSNLKSKFDPDNVILGAGCNAVLENLCMCLADPGDAILIPTPYYAAFEFDLVSRAGCRIVPVNTFEYQKEEAPSSREVPVAPEFYYPNESSLDAAYDKAVMETGRAPRVLLLSHPNNPLGICYPPSVMKECIAWCRERKVHLISDEIYAGSVYREKRSSGEHTFVSAMALGAKDDNASESSGLGLGPYVHLVYALSKDFALSGLRVGAAYTENQEIKLPFQKLNDLCQISSQTQLLVERMLRADAVAKRDDGRSEDASQKKFVDVYLRENQQNVRARCDKLQSHLDELRIPHLPADSGLFVWMDLREFLPSLPSNITEATESIESKERRERQLYLSLMKDFGLLFTPGMSMRNERAGFFRFVFTAAGEEEFELGLTRLTEFVESMRA